MLLVDLEAIEARLKAPRPDPGTLEFWRWVSQRDFDLRNVIGELKEMRALTGTLMQEGAGRLD